MMAMRKFIGVGLLVTLMSTGVPAQVMAQSDADAADIARQVESLSAEGAQSFRAGDYDKAIEFFEQAYALDPVPNLLYNIGRCYEQMEQWDEAIAQYERFMVAPDVESEARSHAMERVQSLREIQAMQAREDGSTGDGAQDEGPDDVIATPQPAPPNRTPGIITTAGGVALIGGGVVMGLMASGNAESITDPQLSYDDRLSARDSARTQALVADVFYASGIAVTALGIYLIVSADSVEDNPQASRSVLTPWVGKGSAGVGLTLGF
ncbi:tetratricopeptide repeat protein [Lujinxingia vulgaris]|uniref:Tetratricopeptide repeat protein n=2 Tax=Lujinxingia vulgaris TaxID=2600176 RepID=A0A5C6XHY0_9DELT|nr:tetratricopeptide repeat protein [Lujinxingia vulgaris]